MLIVSIVKGKITDERDHKYIHFLCGLYLQKMMEGSIILRLNNYKLKFLAFTLIPLLLTGCSINISDLLSNASDFVSESTDSVLEQAEENGIFAPQQYTVDTFKKVFKLVQEKDTQAIFDMFSEYAKENVDIMPDIEKLVEFMNGEITEIGYISASNDYKSVRDGETTSAGYSANSYIKTSNEITYWFKVGTITVDEDETKLGLDWIYILNCDVKNEYVDKRIEWNERRINGAKEDEPQRPEDMEVGVNY